MLKSQIQQHIQMWNSIKIQREPVIHVESKSASTFAMLLHWNVRFLDPIPCKTQADASNMIW